MILALLAVTGCNASGGDDAPPCNDNVLYADHDNDGYGDGAEPPTTACAAPDGYVSVADDCDDTRADVHPGALETCNGLDDDCNLATDDDVPGAPTWFADTDLDGHGDPGVSLAGCEALGGYVATSDDCDDSNAAVHPDAAEVCDGLDNDCDLDVDEGLPEGPWFRDADGDGHGDPDDSVTDGCAAPVGYVAAADDCDDLHVHAYTGAPESLTDGVDDACDGTTSITPAEDLPLWKAAGTIGAELGYSIAPGGDFNGDKVPDLALGGGLFDAATLRRGKVVVFPGPFEVTDDFVDDTSASAVLFGPAELQSSDVHTVGDLDADGFDDMLICDADGAYAETVHAYVVRGPLSGTIDLTTDIQRYGAPWSIHCSELGDVDGDDVPDIVIGAGGAESGGVAGGAAYVLSGPAEEESLDDAGQILAGTLTGESIGDDVVGVGDVDGDGLRDFSVGNAACAFNCDLGTAAYLVTDHSTGTYHPEDVGVAVYEKGGPQDGFVVRPLDDVNGDGYNDVGFAPEGYDVANVYTVFEGPFGSEPALSLLDDADMTISSSSQSGIRWLAWATPLGDWNGDGSGALALADAGLTSAEASGGGCGRAYVQCMQGAVYIMAEPLDGGAHDLRYEADRIDGNYQGGWLGFGSGPRGGTDLNGDGTPDLVFGIPNADVSHVGDSGAAYILFGGGTP